MSGDDFDPMLTPQTQQGWHADPYGRHAQRWWNGKAWSEKVRTNTFRGIDPPGIVRAPVTVTEEAPAAPIEDALLPLRRPRIADKLAVLLGCVVFLALVAVFVVALTA